MDYLTDFHSPWQNLPMIKKYKDIEIHFAVKKEPGWFYDNFDYVIQIMRNNQCCTVTFHIVHDFSFFSSAVITRLFFRHATPRTP